MPWLRKAVVQFAFMSDKPNEPTVFATIQILGTHTMVWKIRMPHGNVVGLREKVTKLGWHMVV